MHWSAAAGENPYPAVLCLALYYVTGMHVESEVFCGSMGQSPLVTILYPAALSCIATGHVLCRQNVVFYGHI
jgi:hypothetical protein